MGEIQYENPGDETEKRRRTQVELAVQREKLKKEMAQNREFASNLGELILDLDGSIQPKLLYELNAKGVNGLYHLVDQIQRNEHETLAEIILKQLAAGKDVKNEDRLISELVKLAC